MLDVNPLYGQDTYNGQFSKPTCAQLGQAAGCTIAADATSYNLADFIFGLPSSVNLGNNFVSNLRQQVHSLYVQDDWRVTPKLTLNLGLRWEFASPLVDRDNNWSDFNPATNTMTRATGGSWYNRALVNPDYKDFGPRLGFAYNFMPKMVLRGGYGISYDFFNRVGSAIEGHQRSAGAVRRIQPDHSGGRPRAFDVPDHREQLHQRNREPRELQSAGFERRLHSRELAVAVHPELVPLAAARDHQRHGGRTRLQRKPQPAPADHRGSTIKPRRTRPAER